jgi:uncharacterized protein
MVDVVLYGAIFSASVVSGMLGIGVAFAAIPILGIGGMDLINEIQPIALFLNGVTALFSAVSFARAGYVDWRRAFALAFVASIFSPLGALAAEETGETVLWITYFLAVIVVVYLLWRDRPAARETLSFNQVLWLSAPISAISGLLGVGPGFLIVPLMIFAGFGPRWAAAINAVAVTPASFISLVPHIEHASVDVATALPIVACAAAGAFLGGYLSSTRISEIALRRLFIVVIVALSIYKGVVLFGVRTPSSIDYSQCPETEFISASIQAKPCLKP